MPEHAVSEIFKYFMTLVIVLFMVFLGAFIMKFNQLGDFEQNTNYTIERHGGLTQDASKQIHKFSREKYGMLAVKVSPGDRAEIDKKIADKKLPAEDANREWLSSASKVGYVDGKDLKSAEGNNSNPYFDTSTGAAKTSGNTRYLYVFGVTPKSGYNQVQYGSKVNYRVGINIPFPLVANIIPAAVFKSSTNGNATSLIRSNADFPD